MTEFLVILDPLLDQAGKGPTIDILQNEVNFVLILDGLGSVRSGRDVYGRTLKILTMLGWSNFDNSLASNCS